ncbi:MAG: hypothetical protein AB1451_15075 [Nitrospirota bacterium]
MNTMNGSCMLVTRGLLMLMSVVFFGVGPALAEEPAARQDTAAAKPVAATPESGPIAQPAHGPQEGIKVHGHWVIEVRNPDGKLVERRDFENALTQYGQIYLADFLRRSSTPGSWAILVFDGLCPGGSTAVCVILESGASYPAIAPVTFPNLQVSGGPGSLVLSGSLTASAAGNVTDVAAQVGRCGPDAAPQNCGSGFLYGQPFTSRQVSPPVPVQQGQIVQITVTISFS